MTRWGGAALACIVVAACGGRSGLEPGDSSTSPQPTSPAGSSGNPGPGNAKPDPGNSSPDPGNSDPDPSNPDPDPSTPDPGTPDPGTGSPDPGHPTPGNPNPTPTPDANCTSDHAKGGMACSMPCVTTCGYYDLGTRSCDCVNGVFVSCHCPRPLNYQGSTTAPPCNTVDGRTHWLDNTACTAEWAECIGNDPVSGTNPRGCVCLTDPVNGKLEWTCGSTNKWFLPE